ncbi:hypothetical protein H6G36_29235 [Anabaena minutissima FACHB-250]|nr:hypothetical protein [Anabaena minutissima FACHB-250]
MESKTIALKLTQSTNITPLFTPSLASAKVSSLRAVATINSLSSTGLPNFLLEDSETERLQKALDLEWNSPRIQLNLYIGNNNEWLEIGAVSLINQLGVPYRNYNLIPLFSDKDYIELGSNTTLGLKAVDVGYGLLTNNDIVAIHGFYTQEGDITLSQPFTQLLIQNTSQVILPFNEARKYAIFTNEGTSKLYLNLGGTAEIGKGIPLLPGGSYEITQDINYKGIVSAIALGNTTLVGLESI